MKLKSWSYSTLKTYRTCPAKVGFKLSGIREPESEAMARGTDIHLQAELFVKEKQKRLPESLIKFKKEFFKVQGMEYVRCEEEWAFTKDWAPCAWDSKDAWVRMKVDALYVAMKGKQRKLVIIDYKTGKTYDENKPQLSLYATAAFIMHPEIDVVEGELWYLDLGSKHTDRFERSELEDMKEAWAYDVRGMMADTIFAPRPNYKCKWCFYAKNKNGNCEFGA